LSLKSPTALSFEKDDLRQKNVSSVIIIIIIIIFYISIFLYIPIYAANTCFVYPEKENVTVYGVVITDPKHTTCEDSLTSAS